MTASGNPSTSYAEKTSQIMLEERLVNQIDKLQQAMDKQMRVLSGIVNQLAKTILHGHTEVKYLSKDTTEYVESIIEKDKPVTYGNVTIMDEESLDEVATATKRQHSATDTPPDSPTNKYKKPHHGRGSGPHHRHKSN